MTRLINVADDDFGQVGFDVITGTETDGGGNQKWFAIQVVGDATATLSVTNVSGDNLPSTTLSAGQVIYVTASSVAVTDGTVLAYRVEG